jgi:hypothetical protein
VGAFSDERSGLSFVEMGREPRPSYIAYDAVYSHRSLHLLWKPGYVIVLVTASDIIIRKSLDCVFTTRSVFISRGGTLTGLHAKIVTHGSDSGHVQHSVDMESTSDQGNTPSGSAKRREFVEQLLSNY